MRLCFRPARAALVLWLLTAGAEAHNDKARRYYDALLKRPVPGALFDRFYTAWLETGTLEELEEYLRTSADQEKEGASTRLLLAAYYSKQNDPRRAAAEYGKALERLPGSPETWQQRALAESRIPDAPAALASLEKALALTPPAELDMTLRQFQGRLLAKDGRPEEALHVWKQLMGRSPGDAALKEDIIAMQVSEGLKKEAVSTARALLAQTTDPYQKVQRQMRLGDLLARAGDRDGALAEYAESLSHTGGGSWLEKEILTQMEQLFRREDAVGKLRDHIQALLEKHPQRLSLHRRHATLLAENGDTPAALRQFQEVLKLAPGDRTVREEYIHFLSQSKMNAEAAAQMEELIRQLPADGELLVRLTELYHEGGKREEVKTTAERFLHGSDQSEAAFLRTAALLERCKEEEASLALYRRTADAFQDSESAGDALAVALHRNGKREEALAEWRKLAAGAGKSRLGTVARSAGARNEHAFAWELLNARAGEFQDDALFLTQLCDEATRIDKFAEALPYARKLVNLAQDASTLETALTMTVRIADRALQSEALAKELASATSPQDRCLLAELLDKSGKRREADAVLESVAAAVPELVATLRVRLCASRGDDAGAARVMQALVESPGGQKPARVQRLVELLVRAGDETAALQWLAVWKKLSPGAPGPWLREASLHTAAGRKKEALQTLRRAASLFDSHNDLKLSLASACRNDGLHAEATRLFTAMYEEAQDLPDKLRLVAELAKTATAAGRTAELVETFEERRRDNRTSIVPLLSLAEIHQCLGNSDARRTVLMEAARLAPENSDLQLQIVKAAESEEDWELAIQILRDLAAKDHTGAMHSRLVSLLLTAGREEEALRLMDSLTAAGKVDARQAETMAASLASAQEWETCVQFLAPLTARHPQDYRLAWLYALALEESGDPSAARDAFLRLTAITGELPGVAPATVPVVLPSAASLVPLGPAGFTPSPLLPELDGYQRNLGVMSLSYAYSQGRRSFLSFLSSRPKVPVPIPFPRSVEEVAGMALPHLRKLSDGDPIARVEAVEALSRAGLPDADIYMEAAPERPGREPVLPGVLYLKFPDRLLTQLLMASDAIGGGPVSPVLASTLAEQLRPVRLQLSKLVAMCMAFSEDAEEVDQCLRLAPELFSLAKSDAAVRSILVTMLISPTVWKTRVFPGRGAVRATTQLHFKVVELLDPLLPEWYRSSSPADPVRLMLYFAITERLITSKDYTGLFQFLEAEMALPAATQTPGTMVQVRNSQSSLETSLLNRLGFPRTGSDFPATVKSILTKGGAFIVASPGIRSYLRPPVVLSLSPADIHLLLPSVKDPVLRMLLAADSGSESLVNGCVPALEKMEKPSPSGMILLAGWLEKQGQYAAALEALRKAPGPITPADQILIDGAVARWAMETVLADGKIDEKNPLIPAGREAALRLRKIPVIRGLSNELSKCLDTLGLEDEAQRYAASAPSRMPRGLSSASRSGTARTPGQKDWTESLIASGRRGEALRVVEQDLKRLCRQWIATGGEGGIPELNAWKARVIKLGLKDDLLKAVDPGASQDGDALAVWGATQDVFHGPEKALDFYRRAMTAKPANFEFFVLAFRTAWKVDPETGASILAGADHVMLARAKGVLQKLDLTIIKVPDRIKALEGMVTCLERMKPDTLRSADLNWALPWVRQFTVCRTDSDKMTYGSLRGPDPHPAGETVSDEAVQVRRRWYDAATKACVLLMKNGPLATSAFSDCMEIRHCYEPDADYQEICRLADQVLVLSVERWKAGHPVTEKLFYWPPETTVAPWQGISPGEWMLRSAVLQKKPDIISHIPARLREAGATEEADQLDTIIKLSFCPETEFAATALGATGNKAGQSTGFAFTGKILAVMKERNLDADLSALFLGLARENARVSEGAMEANRTWCLHLRNRHGPQALTDFITRQAEAWLGPVADRTGAISRAYTPDSSTGPAANVKMHAWLALSARMAREPALSLPVLSSLENQFLIHCKNPGDAAISYSTDDDPLSSRVFYSRTPDEIARAFHGTAALADLADFDLPVITAGSGITIPRSWFRIMRPAKTTAKLMKVFAAEPPTFGTAFMTASISDSPADALLALLGQRVEDLEKLPPARQRRIALLYRTAVADAAEPKSTDDAVDKGKAWLNAVPPEAAK